MRQIDKRSLERGDTIIEVIFATAIFAFVAITSLTIMNQGIATGERALETTLVRQQMDAQAEALRFIHEAKIATPGFTGGDNSPADTWNRFITDYRQSQASKFGELGANNSCVVPTGSFRPFILDARRAQIWGTPKDSNTASSLPPFAQVAYDDNSIVRDAYGIWIESVPGGDNDEGYFVDFHIRACWDVPSRSRPMTLGTIVRLYDPI